MSRFPLSSHSILALQELFDQIHFDDAADLIGCDTDKKKFIVLQCAIALEWFTVNEDKSLTLDMAQLPYRMRIDKTGSPYDIPDGVVMLNQLVLALNVVLEGGKIRDAPLMMQFMDTDMTNEQIVNVLNHDVDGAMIDALLAGIA